MKLKTLLAALLATYLLPSAANCQTNGVAADQSVAAVADTNAASASVPTNAAVVTAEPAVAADTNAPMASAPATVPASGTNETTDASSANTAAPAVANIPLIQFQDVPLTTAIEALARQANINYLLDPKIGLWPARCQRPDQGRTQPVHPLGKHSCPACS